jgi:hypothetical protein
MRNHALATAQFWVGQQLQDTKVVASIYRDSADKKSGNSGSRHPDVFRAGAI